MAKTDVANRLIWHKGEILNVNVAMVNVLSPTSQFGLNVFEGIPCYWNDDEKQLIVLLTLTNSKAILSTGELNSEGFRAIDTNVPLSYGSLYNQEGVEYKEVEYTPNMKRDICVIDPETTEELKPRLYFDEKENKVKGKCKLKPNKAYFAFEIRQGRPNNN